MTALQPLAPDLAGSRPLKADIQPRIRSLIDRYLPLGHLNDRLHDLPQQFQNPEVRPWQAIDWKSINAQQIIGIKRETFLAILLGAINTEAPIRDYTQASRQYLETLHPEMARFVGGQVNSEGKLLEPGLWEKEERQHTPALSRIYTQITGEKPVPIPHSARPHQANDDPRTALYRHGLHRIATEYGATCLYLWLMAHTTGPLQQVLKELLIDEVNHMTKFWGFGCWAYPEANLTKTAWMLLQTSGGRLKYRRDRSSLFGTVQRMTQALAWSDWSWSNRISFAFTCVQVLLRMQAWLKTVQHTELEILFQDRPSSNR